MFAVALNRTMTAAAVVSALFVCAEPAFAQAGQTACPTQQGAPRQPLQRLWAGEYATDATPGAASCTPRGRGVVNCTARGPSVIWADVDMTHHVIPAGRTANFTLDGDKARCMMNGPAVAQAAPKAPPAVAPRPAPAAQSAPAASAAAPPAVSTTACQRSPNPPLPQQSGLPALMDGPPGWAIYGKPNIVSCVARRGGATCQVRGPGQVLFAVQDTELYTVPAGRTATFSVRESGMRNSCFLNQGVR